MTFAFPSQKDALHVSKAIGPDNLNLPQGLKIRTKVIGKRLIATVVSSDDIGSLAVTLDDLIAGVIVADESLKTVIKSRTS